MVSVQYLREALRYDPQTGVFIWRDDRPRSHFKAKSAWLCYLSRDANKEAGSKVAKGYRQINIGGNGPILAHRIAFAIHHGIELQDLPSHLDHRDGVRSNNAIDNLRPATATQNGHNRAISSNTTSGYKGVSWHKSMQKWAANIQVAGRKVHLGYFLNPEDGHKAYVLAANNNFGEYARAA